MSALALQSDDYMRVEPLGPAEKAEIVDALYKHFSMQKVVEATGYDLRRIMTAIDEDPEFSNAMALAERHLSVIGEDELKRRAIHGVDSVVVANGRVVYQVVDGVRKPMVETKYSDTLLKTYLEANRRDKFGAKLEVTTTHKGVIALPAFSPEMMQLLLADARGETVQLVVDEGMNATDKPEVVDAEFSVVSEDANADAHFERADDATIRERVKEMTQPRETVPESATEFDIL
jgi:hypothetical protein